MLKLNGEQFISHVLFLCLALTDRRRLRNDSQIPRQIAQSGCAFSRKSPYSVSAQSLLIAGHFERFAFALEVMIMKKAVFGLLLFVAVTLVLCIGFVTAPYSQDARITTASLPSPSVDPATRQPHNLTAVTRVPAYHHVAPQVNTLPPTLSPELFTGNKRLAYQAAKEFPQTLAQLPCYCHCDKGHGHNSLHSCLESEHGENCGICSICIGEALMAYHLERQGKLSVAEIRQRIIPARAANADRVGVAFLRRAIWGGITISSRRHDPAASKLGENRFFGSSANLSGGILR